MILAELSVEALQVGDIILGFETSQGVWKDRTGDASWTITSVCNGVYIVGETKLGEEKTLFWSSARRYKIDRPWAYVAATMSVVNATANFGQPAKTIPNWPISCPRCGKAASAVLLFQGYDCRHGCYR